MSRARIGISVGRSMVRGVRIEHDVITWREERERQPETALSDVVREVVTGCRGRSFLRVPVFAALAPAVSQFRPLHGLPQGIDGDLAHRIVEADPRRFLIGGPSQLLVARATQFGGSLWITALDRATVDAIAVGCKESRSILKRCSPSVGLLGAMRPDELVQWNEDEIAVEVILTRGRLAQRVTHKPDFSDASTTRPSSFEAAIAAAVTANATESGIDPLARARRRNGRRALHVVVAAAGAAFLVAGAVLPGFTAQQREKMAMAGLDALAVQSEQSAQVLETIARRTRIRSAIREFEQTPHALGRLAEITSAMPDRAAVVSLRLDLDRIALVALAPSGADVLERLGALAWIDQPQIVGAITREHIESNDVQRVAIAARIVDRPTSEVSRADH